MHNTESSLNNMRTESNLFSCFTDKQISRLDEARNSSNDCQEWELSHRIFPPKWNYCQDWMWLVSFLPTFFSSLHHEPQVLRNHFSLLLCQKPLLDFLLYGFPLKNLLLGGLQKRFKIPQIYSVELTKSKTLVHSPWVSKFKDLGHFFPTKLLNRLKEQLWKIWTNSQTVSLKSTAQK